MSNRTIVPLRRDRVELVADEFDDKLVRPPSVLFRGELEYDDSLVEGRVHSPDPSFEPQIACLGLDGVEEEREAPLGMEPPEQRAVPEEQSDIAGSTVEAERAQAASG